MMRSQTMRFWKSVVSSPARLRRQFTTLTGRARRMNKLNLPRQHPKPLAIVGYATAALSVCGAIIAADLVTRLFHAEAIASLMLCAVIFAAWFGGFGPALLAIALALLAFHYYLVPPINSFARKNELFAVGISEVPRLFLFSIVSLAVALVISAQRRATETLRRSRDELQIAIKDQKRSEAALLRSEMYLTEAQRLSGTGSFGWNIVSGEIIWSDQTFRIFGGDRTTKPTVEFIIQRTHPEDRAAVQQTVSRALVDGQDFEHEYRLLMPDGSMKYIHAVARAVQDASGNIEFVGAVTDVTVAKETERKLRRSDAYLAESERLRRTSSWAWDVRRRGWAYRSPGMYGLFGFDPEQDDVPLQSFRDRVHPEDRHSNVEAAARAIREKADFEIDFRIVLPDGSIKHIHSVGHPVVGSDGDVIELVGTHIDVTEQHTAKEALQKAFDEIKQSEDRLRLVIDTIPTLVWRAGPEGNPDFLNQPALDYTGLSLDQAAAGWPRAFHPEDMASMLEKWRAIRMSGMRGELEARLRRFDGEYRWFLHRAEPLRDELGNIVKWYGSSTDIEDRKRTEEALRASEQRFRDYAETASDWLWETGPDHSFTRVSEELTPRGIDPTSRIGGTRWDFATDVEEESEKWRLHIAALEEHQPFRGFVYRTAGADGSVVYIATSGKPVFDADAGFLGYRGVSSNVTAAIRADQAEKALHQAQAELARVTRVTTLGELAASIAHEVNQPLAAIGADANACLHWLATDRPDLDSVREALTAIVKDGERAGAVITRIRTLLARTSVAHGPCDITTAIRDVLPLIGPEIGRHGILLQTSLAPDLPQVMGDRIQLQQVLLNLLLNAAEAMRDVPPVRRRMVVRASADHRDDGPWAIVAVADAGVGFGEAEAPRLFEAFYTTKPGGLGMGLSISRSIINNHRGRLWATANSDHGATFQFALPGMR